MKIFLTVSLLLITLILVSACTHTVQIDDKAYEIGVILPLTGDLGFIGSEAQRGINLAADEINALDGIELKVIYEDDGFLDSTKAVSAAAKLLNIDEVDASIITIIDKINITV